MQHKIPPPGTQVHTRVDDIERYDKFKTREETIRQRNLSESKAKENGENQIPTPENAWDILKNGFSLTGTVTESKKAKSYEKWLRDHPLHLEKLNKRIRLVLPYIIEEIQERKLPLELALVPIIESDVNTFATSSAKAAGLWQIMPETGKWLGLEVGDTIDERRNIIESTAASLDYLKYLAGYYDENWELGITSYNAGNGTVDKALRKAGRNKTYQQPWKLPLKKESRDYYAKLIGLREYIKKTGDVYPELDPVYMVDFFTASRTAPGRAFKSIAREYNSDIEVIAFLNADFLSRRTSKNKTTILIPKDLTTYSAAEDFALDKMKITTEKHKVKNGESLGVIANRYKTSVSKLKRLNKLSSNLIRIGQTLLIPVF